MIDRLSETLQFQARALELRSERQSLIAANIANADTPGYKAVDADFAAALRRATAPASPGTKPAQARLLSAEIHERPAAQAARDANTVDMDAERARFAENAVRYEAALKTLNHQVKALLSVITG
ncbi:MAG: flagellar basal body rod protein FlgB [Betaproteobacteria bacterium]|nr:flagellar basal body rod protein FlgB [Betaproteobacteria bacterium]